MAYNPRNKIKRRDAQRVHQVNCDLGWYTMCGKDAYSTRWSPIWDAETEVNCPHCLKVME
jgi:hypothetical protein